MSPIPKLAVAMLAVLAVSPVGTGQVTQQAYIKASNTEPSSIGDFFSRDVALSGDTLVVGAPQEDSRATGVDGDQSNNDFLGAGAVYVFVRDGTSWSQQAYLKASNTQGADEFGTAVAIDGDTLAIGAPREDSQATGVNGDQGDNSAEDAGAVYVFVRDDGVWTQQAYLKASNAGGGGPFTAGDYFGTALALSADTLVVGAANEDSAATGVDGDASDNSAPEAGAAYVFVRDGTSWSQQAYLKASNTGSMDRFGDTLDVSAGTIVVGANDESSMATGVNGDGGNDDAFRSGAAYVFTRDGTTWSQQAYLKASNTEEEDAFGIAVSVSHDTVVVGARSEDSSATGVNGDETANDGSNSGAAYVFVRDGASWSQQAYLKASNTGAGFGLGSGDEFGVAVTVDGDAIVVGAPSEDSNADGIDGNQDNNGAQEAGAAYVFVRDGTEWSQLAYVKASNSGSDDRFGQTVTVADDTAVIGAPWEASNATGVNGAQNNNLSFLSGAAYVIDLDLELPECLLVVGDGPGRATWLEIGHVFQTHLDQVHDSFGVLMEDLPEFVLPTPGRSVLAQGATVAGPGLGTSAPTDIPEWMWDGEFSVQILLWNPVVFPWLPEQCSYGLHVVVLPDGGVSARPYGSGTGIQVWAETGVDAQGRPVVRFPFSIPGL